MKAIYLLCLFFLSASAVINQEAQRREAPAFPQREYGPPQRQQGPVIDQRQRQLHAMQRLIAAMRNGGYNGQARVVNRPQPIPIRNTYGPPQQPVAKPQQSYGVPSVAGGHSSSSGSLEAFTHNHNPDVRCDGWIPIPGPSIPHSAGGHSSSGASIDTSYGPPKHSSGGSLNTLIVVPEDTSYSSGSSSASSGSIDTSYGVPQPPSHPQKEYGPPTGSNSFGSGSSSSFGGSSSNSFSSGSSGSFGSIDTSYGVPQPPSQPQKEYGPPTASNSFGSGSSSSFGSSSSNSFSSGSSGSFGSIDTSYGVPPPPKNPQREYGPPPSKPQKEYGPPATTSSFGSGSSSSFGSSNSFSGGSSNSFGSIDTSYGVPPEPRKPQNNYGPPVPPAPPAPIAPVPISPHNTYGTPNSFASGSSASSGSFANQEVTFDIPPPAPIAPQNSYGPPAPPVIPISPPQNTYGPPSHNSGSANSINTPDSSYGPPIIVGSGHASSASAIASIDNTYGPPNHQPAPVIENNYLPPQALTSSGHSSSGSVSSSSNTYSGPAPVGHLTYGVPQQPQDFGPPESSYGPPPSGLVEFKHSSTHDGTIDTIPNLPTEIQLPNADSGAHFDNAIGLVSSTLGVSGNSEVIKSQAIHESHTSEIATSNSFSSGSGFSSAGSSDSYSAPPLDSYAPGKYAPSFATRKPNIQPQRPIAPPQRPIHHPPPPPQRPITPPRSNYGPPIPTKTVPNRPQVPPPNFRPLNNHAQSVAHSYSSQSHSIQQTPARPIRPLIHRQPVPQGLLQSIGQNVQAQDAQRGISHGLSGGKTYLPPPTNDIPIPPMKLIVPNPGPIQQFQHHSHSSHSQSGGVATSSSSFSLQNQDLRHVHVIHDCGKGPQLQNTYGTPLQGQVQTYQAPLVDESHSAVLSAGYEIPAQGLEVPQHNSINFNAPQNTYGPPSNSYGPPASGHLEVVGLESRNNAVVTELTHSESRDSPRAELPGLNSGLSSSGLDFISAIKSHSIEVPQNQGPVGNFQLQIQGSKTQDNRIDGTNHKQILDDGLLQSILTAIEQKPAQSVPQVSEDAETEHTEAKTFLKSREGQEVLGDKPIADAKKN